MKSGRNNLTIKQRRFVKRTLETGNPTKAVLDTYDASSRASAASIASQNLRKVAIRDAIEEGLASEGLTPRYIFGKLKKVLDNGAEANAKASDAVSAAKTLLKAHEIADKGRMGGSMGITIQVDGLPRSELIEARKRLSSRWNEILEN